MALAYSSLLPPQGLRQPIVAAAASAGALLFAYSVVNGGVECATGAGLPIVAGFALGWFGLIGLAVGWRRGGGLGGKRRAVWAAAIGVLLAPFLTVLWWFAPAFLDAQF